MKVWTAVSLSEGKDRLKIPDNHIQFVGKLVLVLQLSRYPSYDVTGSLLPYSNLFLLYSDSKLPEKA